MITFIELLWSRFDQISFQNIILFAQIIIATIIFSYEDNPSPQKKKTKTKQTRWFSNQTSYKQMIKDDDVNECISIE